MNVLKFVTRETHRNSMFLSWYLRMNTDDEFKFPEKQDEAAWEESYAKWKRMGEPP